jgi:galactokinase
LSAFEANKNVIEEEVYRRALHVVNETEYTLKFVEFLESKNYAEAGRCMLASHNSLRSVNINLFI